MSAATVTDVRKLLHLAADRIEARNRRPVEPTPLLVNRPTPHAGQLPFVTGTEKRKVVVAGRRGGKTTGAAIRAVDALQQGRRVLEAAPTADQTTAFWETCKRILQPSIDAGLLYKNESERVLELLPRGGPRIRAKTAWDADTLRGDYADLLILDEYQMMHPNVWDLVGAPMLLDNDGDAIFIFTPQRKNHAYQQYLRAINDDSGRWGHWHFRSMDNPHLSTAAMDEITGDMTEDAYRQEILAEFLDSEGAVFRNIPACLGAPKHATPDEHTDHRIVIGADWGKQQDRTAFSVFCVTCKAEVEIDYSREVDYHVQRQRLEVRYERWGADVVHAEANAMGEPIIEELIRSGLHVIPFQTTAVSKPPLIESLALAFERTEAQWIDDPIGTAELEAYERSVTPATNRSRYSAPEGMNDDTVIARALAWAMASLPPAAGASSDDNLVMQAYRTDRSELVRRSMR